MIPDAHRRFCLFIVHTVTRNYPRRRVTTKRLSRIYNRYEFLYKWGGLFYGTWDAS